MPSRVPFPFAGRGELPDPFVEELYRNFAELEKDLDGITGSYDASVSEGVTDNPAARSFSTVHAAATYLDSIGLTNAAILVTGTITETAALVAANAPATVTLYGQRAVWNLDNFASAWTTLTVRSIDVRPGTTKATRVFATTTLVTRNMTLTSSLPTTPISITDGTHFGFDDYIGNVSTAGNTWLHQPTFTSHSRTFAGSVTYISDGLREVVNSSRTWTMSGSFVFMDMRSHDGTSFGNTLGITVSAALYLYSRWGTQTGSGNTALNPCYISLTVSGTGGRACLIEGSYLGALSLASQGQTATVDAHFGDVDIAGPALLNLVLGEHGGNGLGRATLRGQCVGTIESRFLSTSGTLITGTALIGSALSIVASRISGAAGTSRALALDASSTRNVIVFPRITTAAGIFGSAYTDAGSLNLVIDENGVAPAAHAASHLPGGSDALTTATAITLSGSNAEGTAASFARSDHNHALGGTTGGDLTGSLPNPTLVAIITAGGPVGSVSTTPAITWDAKGRLTTVTTITTGVGITFGDGAATSFNHDHNLGTLDVIVEFYVVSTGAQVWPDTLTHSTTNRVISTWDVAPTASELRVVVKAAA